MSKRLRQSPYAAFSGDACVVSRAYLCKGLNSDQIAAALDVPTSEELLVAEAMRTAREVSRVHAQDMWDALIKEGVWLSQARAAFLVACTFLQNGICLPDDACPRLFLQFLRTNAASLKTVATSFLHRRRASREKLGAPVLATNPAACPEVITVRDEDPVAYDDGYMCMICGKTFATERTCAIHLARHHGISTASTQVCFGTRCEVCLQEFRTFFRLQQHLKKSQKCLRSYLHNDLEGEPAGTSEDRRSHSWQPAVRTPGPQPFWATQCPPGP